MTEEGMAAMKFLEEVTAGGGLAYNAYQSAQPQTLAYALQDSRGEPDYIITNAAIYWLTGTIGSSIRRYFADVQAAADAPTEPTSTPTGVAIFAEDFQSVRKLADRDHANIISWNHYDRGSHFSPHDAPDLLLADIRQLFRPLR
jgi:epoxide hydrolase